jgi:uncharacterized membrane protein
VSDAPTYHLSVFAYDFREVAKLCLDKAHEAAKDGVFVLSDWAVISNEDGKVKIKSSKGANPGPVRGGLFGGGAGAVLAVLSGPIGAGAMLSGAAVGAITAGLVDSGFAVGQLEEISAVMRPERSILLLAVPLEDTEKLNAFVAATQAFNGVDGRLDIDITPTHTLADAIAEHQVPEEA